MKVAFRVDGAVESGGGHVGRCLTLAGQLSEWGAAVLFVCRHLTDGMHRRIAAAGFECAMLASAPGAAGDLQHSAWLGTSQDADADATIAALGQENWDWLVVDHYALDARWEKQLAPCVNRILAIDDLGDRAHACDVLLDQNLQDAGRYMGLVPASAKQLIGPRYALLRPDFRRAALPSVTAPRNINVFFGTTDPRNMTILALQGLRRLQDTPVDVVIGSDNPHRDAITAACHEGESITLHVEPPDFIALLAKSRLALGAGGSTSWERCCLGVPSILISVADNQRSGADALAKAGAAVDLGPMENLSPRRIEEAVTALLMAPEGLAAMSGRARALVDGRGAERVALYMMRQNLRLRPARQADRKLAWEWRNSPSVRAQSFDPSPLDPDSHVKWWDNALKRTDRMLLIGHCGDLDVGVLRFDCDGADATVSIYIDPALANLGIGNNLLQAGETWLGRNRADIKTVIALIREDNQASLRSFQAAGYHLDAARNAWIRAVQPVESQT